MQEFTKSLVHYLIFLFTLLLWLDVKPTVSNAANNLIDFLFEICVAINSFCPLPRPPHTLQDSEFWRQKKKVWLSAKSVVKSPKQNHKKLICKTVPKESGNQVMHLHFSEKLKY